MREVLVVMLLPRIMIVFVVDIGRRSSSSAIRLNDRNEYVASVQVVVDGLLNLWVSKVTVGCEIQVASRDQTSFESNL